MKTKIAELKKKAKKLRQNTFLEFIKKGDKFSVMIDKRLLCCVIMK